MKDFQTKIRGVLFFFILILFVIPLVQDKFKFIKLEPLKGAFSETEKKYFSFKNWFSGEYQVQEEKYLNESFGFRNIFVRLNNQLAFNLFNKAKANSVIIGKNNYLFEENYIKAYNGTDFIGIDSIKHRMQKLKFVYDTLSKLNKSIIMIFAAGKGTFYPEYFPDKYKTKKGITNYEIHLKLAQEYGLNYIDFNKYFIDNKYKSKYPLYPQYGIHWSNYGSALAADSIIRFIEKTRKIDMPNLFWTKIDKDYAKDVDYDIGDGMNLLFRLKSQLMATPKIQFESDNGKTKPTVLVVSDSYYWGMYGFGINRAFSKDHFWYYNKQIYPESYQSTTDASQLDLKEQIEKHEVFIIMATEANLPDLGWGFIENMYDFFKGIRKKTQFDIEFQKKVKKKTK
jgi:lipopolysaccharide export LptBFGC system permease protein LptF